MARWWETWALGAVVVLIVAIGLIFLQPTIRTVQCDGSIPRWMIDAQDYNGGGCAQLLPTHEAPAGADWSPYCLGLCIADE